MGVVFALLVATVGAACSLLLDTSGDQCKTTADCVARGGSFAPMQCINRVCQPTDAGADVGPVDAGPWGCLGSVVFPPLDASTVNIIVPLVDLQTTKPVTTGLNALLCAKLDPKCIGPLATTKPNSSGLLTFPNVTQLPFDGYVLIEPIIPDGGVPSDAGDAAPPPDFYVPSLVYFNPPIVRDTVYTPTILVKLSALGSIAAATQTPLDPSLGAVFMETVDCNGKAASGVSISIDALASGDAGTRGFYFKNGFPTLTAASTDVTGYAGFVNTPLGPRTVTGTLQATGQRIGTTSVLSAQNFISYTTLAPSP